MGAQVVVLDALVREAQATPGTAIGCGQAVFSYGGTFLRSGSGRCRCRRRTLALFANSVAQIYGGCSNGGGERLRSHRLLRLLLDAGRSRLSRNTFVGKAQTASGATLGMGQTIFAIFGTGFLRDAGSAVLSATEPIICLNGGWNEYGSNAGTRWHRDAFVGKTQTAARAAFGMGQTIFSVRRALSIALSLAVIDQRRCHYEQQDQLLHFRKLQNNFRPFLQHCT